VFLIEFVYSQFGSLPEVIGLWHVVGVALSYSIVNYKLYSLSKFLVLVIIIVL